MPLKILGISGSLRKNSYNTAALYVAQKLEIPDIKIEIFDLNGIPIYNQDQEMKMPAVVTKFKSEIRSSDALLIATPEYNYSISGVLKNAIDWASRPSGDNSWDGKPIAIMGASQGMFGTARAQYDLRKICVTLNMFPINKPEVMIGSAHERFDPNGNLTDEKTKKKIEELILSLVKWTKQIKSTPTSAG